jgi:hypothetical protein
MTTTNKQTKHQQLIQLQQPEHIAFLPKQLQKKLN